MATRKPLAAAALACLVLCTTSGPFRPDADADVYRDVPETPDPTRKHLVYLHGAWIEQHGLDGAHPRHGVYQYERIVAALSAQGFAVISEARLGRADPRKFASRVAGQVRQLLAKGVPPENVTVAGHSKGGTMVLIAAGLLSEPKLSFAVLAGCGKSGSRFGTGYQRLVEEHGSRLRGRILSLYDEDDRVAGTCRRLFDRASDVTSREVVLRTGRGHGLFYAPQPEWIREIVAWAGR